MAVEHSALTSIHKGAYIQSSDPGAVGAKILWLDTTVSGHYVLKRRNDANSGWLGVQFSMNYDQIVLDAGGLLYGDVDDIATILSLSAYFRIQSATLQHKEILQFAVSDETTAITTGTAKVTFRMPFAMTVTRVKATLTTASSSGIPTIDINEGGTTILSTKLTIDASEKTSDTAATAAVISDSALANDAEITIDIDVAGTGATGLKVLIEGWRL